MPSKSKRIQIGLAIGCIKLIKDVQKHYEALYPQFGKVTKVQAVMFALRDVITSNSK